MPKKAKKGGGKGGAKTEEERMLYLQQRAQAEEEMAKKKEEILTLFLRDKLQKEQRNTAVNLLKLNEGWRSILRQTRAAELRDDITVLSQTFERHLDGLDSVIKNLERDLQEAEHQSAQVRRVHLQHVERLWAQQDKRLTFVQQQWESGLQHLTTSFTCDRKQMLANFEQQRADLEDATFAVEQQHKAVMDETHSLFDDIIASYNHAQHQRAELVVAADANKVEKTLQHQEDAKLCSEETIKLNMLTSANQKLIQKNDQDMRKVKLLQDLVMKMRVKMNSSKTENQLVELDLTAARNQVNQKTRELCEQLAETQAATRKQLTELTVHSDNADKKLKAVIAKGERLLRVSEMCDRLESEQQNASLLPPEERRPETQEEPEVTLEFLELQQLMRCVNAAVLRRAALKQRRDNVSQDNEQLRLLLRQHLDAMTVSDHAFNGRHALLTVCPAPTATAPPTANTRHTVIEAVHAVKRSL